MQRKRYLAIFLALALALAVVAAACAGAGANSANSTTATPTASPTAAPQSPTPVAQGTFSTPELVQQLRPSVVHILSEAASIDVFGQTVPSEGVGTGFIIDSQGHIVTNNHVVVQPNTCDTPVQHIVVTLSDGRNFDAKIVGRDVPTDLAVLQINASGLTPAVLGDSATVPVGGAVVAIGNALDLPGGPTVTTGVVSAEQRLIEEQDCGVTIPGAIQTDAAINPGNSGGPLVDTSGQIIGVTTAVISDAQGVGFAISSDTAKPIIQDLIANGKVTRAYLGVSVVPITQSLAATYNLPVDHGVGIQQVQSGGPADKAGLQAGDIIVKIDGTDVNTSGDLFGFLAQHQAGEKVTVSYYRGNSSQSADVTLGASP
jgi:S1-C subfamily serine protease